MSEEYNKGDLFFGGFMGFIVGVLLLLIIKDGIIFDTSTMDEVCTQLSGEPSVVNHQESTSEKIVCNPREKVDEEVLDDGKIILKGYKKMVTEPIIEPLTKEDIENANDVCRKVGGEFNIEDRRCYF